MTEYEIKVVILRPRTISAEELACFSKHDFPYKSFRIRLLASSI